MKIFPMNLTVNVQVENDEGQVGVASNTYAHGHVLTEAEVAAVVKQTADELPDGMRVIDAPATVIAELLVTDGLEDGNSGTAEVSFIPGQVPTEEQIAQAIESVKPQLPDGLRLMTRHEAFLHTLTERTGITEPVALPNLDEGDEWHDPATASVNIRQTQPWRAVDLDEDDEYGLD